MEILKGFKIGQTSAAAFRGNSKMVARAITILEALDSKRRPKEERRLLETRELAERLQIARHYFHQNFARDPALAGHRIKVPGITTALWGSRRAIAQLQRRLKHENL